MMKTLVRSAVWIAFGAVICQAPLLLGQCPDWQANGTQSTTVTNCSVVIGTTSTKQLDVNGVIRAHLNDAFGLQFNKADGTAGDVAGLDHSNTLILKGTGGGIKVRDSSNLLDRLIIQDDGKIGVGTVPGTLLDVKGTIRARVNNAFGLQFDKNDGTAGDVAALDMNNSLILKGAGGGAIFRDSTNLHDLLRIEDGGNVEIGVPTLAPGATEARLHVAGGSAFITGDSGALSGLPSGTSAGLALKYTGSGAQIFGYDYNVGAPKNLILQSPGGNVGIGTTTASARLQVAGSAFIAGDSGGLSTDSGPGLGLKFSTAGAEVLQLYGVSTCQPAFAAFRRQRWNQYWLLATSGGWLDRIK